MKVLITGAGGFLGGWLASYLSRRGNQVIAWCRDDRPTTLDFFSDHAVPRVREDVRDGAAWDRIMVRYQPDALVHLAAESQVRRALALPRETWTSNLQGTVEAMEAARRHRGMLKAIVVASTDKAYGPPVYLPYDESHPLMARAPYDASKAAADMCARSYASTYGLPVAVTRSANIYGGGDLNKDRIIPEVCRAILEGRDIVLRSDGTPERDYVYVEDTCAGYELILTALFEGTMESGEVFNFGSARSTAVKAVVELLLQSAGEEAKGLKVKLGEAHPHTEIDRQCLSAAKIKKLLGWAPRCDLAEGLKKTWDWHFSNREKLLEIYRML